MDIKLEMRVLKKLQKLFHSTLKKYQQLLQGVDPSSSTELNFLNFLYNKGLRLPDATQKIVEGIYCQPDFFYIPDVWVFCDGTPHDNLRAHARALRDFGQ